MTSDPNLLQQLNDLHEHIITVNKDVVHAIEALGDRLSKLESAIDDIEKFTQDNTKNCDYWFPRLDVRLRECDVLPKLDKGQVNMSDRMETLAKNIETASEKVQACREAIIQRVESVLISTDRALGEVSGKDINFVTWIFDCIFGEFRRFIERRSNNQKGFSTRNFSKFTAAYILAWMGFGTMIGGLIWGMYDKSQRLGQVVLTVGGWLISGIFFSLVYARKDDKWETTGPKIWSYHVALATFVVAFIFAL